MPPETEPRSPACRADAEALDRDDPLAPLRDAFSLPDGLVYLDGNSLGACPKRTAARVAETIGREWAHDLITSWNRAGWIDLAARIGDGIATLVGAGPGEISVGDSTSVNLYKVLHVACAMQAADRPGRRTIVSERGNFPTDLYIAESIARSFGLELLLVETNGGAGDDAAIEAALDERLSVLMLTHVDYRSGRMLDMTALTRKGHDAGGLAVWDLAHSAGAVPVDLHGAGADFAVGCGYKYLNGGPGAPAFVWAHPMHPERMDRDGTAQPLSGWLGHGSPFTFTPDYRPAAGIARFVSGTPPILAMRALECGVSVFADAEALGGMAALRAKSLALTACFLDRVEASCPGVRSVTPRDPAMRGSQASLAHDDGYAVMQALIDRGVVGDFRAGDDAAGTPNLLRFGFTPLYTRFVDAWDAAEALTDVLASGVWREPRYAKRAAVT